MGASPVKRCLLGIPTALAVATLVNVNPVLAQTLLEDSALIQTQTEKAKPIPIQSHLNEDSTVENQPQQVNPVSNKGKRELLESQKLSYEAKDLLPEGNTSNFITPTNTISNPEVVAQSQEPQSTPIGVGQWTVEAEALFLTRNIPQDIVTSEIVDLSTTEGGGPQIRGETLRTNDLDFNYELGTRITVGYSRNSKDSFSFSFFGLQEYNSSATLVSPEPGLPSDVVVEVPTDDSPINEPSDSLGDKLNILNQPPPLGQGNGSFSISQAFLVGYEHQINYSSKIYNFELNYQRQLALLNNFRPSFLIGLRYISTPEKFSLTTSGAAAFPSEGLRAYPIGDYDIETRNNLFGIQIGGIANVRLSRSFSLGLQAKVGVLANNGDQTSTISAFDFDTGQLLERIKAVEGKWGVSPVVEGSLSANWQVASNVSLNAGFNLVYLSGLALAPRQFNDFAESGEFGRVDLDGDALYYGPSVGIRVVF